MCISQEREGKCGFMGWSKNVRHTAHQHTAPWRALSCRCQKASHAAIRVTMKFRGASTTADVGSVRHGPGVSDQMLVMTGALQFAVQGILPFVLLVECAPAPPPPVIRQLSSRFLQP